MISDNLRENIVGSGPRILAVGFPRFSVWCEWSFLKDWKIRLSSKIWACCSLSVKTVLEWLTLSFIKRSQRCFPRAPFEGHAEFPLPLCWTIWVQSTLHKVSHILIFLSNNVWTWGHPIKLIGSRFRKKQRHSFFILWMRDLGDSLAQDDHCFDAVKGSLDKCMDDMYTNHAN